ncbi:3-dehydroquinate dehydratase [Marinitoga sp. 1135]|uniref:3-dehydroquinate dehydratase n=1 Tax=Marinitoga piezophila (strain DSM 14283 / JCM 11233 / KA3) TaxID=443254 RepID=H2J600_MARPK|nr:MULTISPECIES: type II 3-dehydroquinate dehydratase [Marinitoga]AEX86219.1 3-dehydroquinate dehydratase, type II [Marinitoga piezophila KA3]APT76631.1 3-dehydroquinate dehydratase [Marinitoga sp. 1137]NUU96406.1 3-dehydroquinate dehydratase [Marinitoga sp. 1135]NUU98327.1 3-dehydroquinate dehydratase [Marinitoga sp. 1138]
MILIVNGPNLNMLGKRPKEIYGNFSYQDLLKLIEDWSEKNKIKTEVFQSNFEGEIINRLQKMDFDGLIINAGAYTHYSYAIKDALEIIDVPKIELHISNIYKREEFRKKSVIAPVCDGQITGLGLDGYILALEYLKKIIGKR